VRATKTVGETISWLMPPGNLVRPAMAGLLGVDRARRTAGSRPACPPSWRPLSANPATSSRRARRRLLPRDLPDATSATWCDPRRRRLRREPGNSYNPPYAPEVLVDAGRPRLIRRRQTLDELLALEEV
jgi:diaminopimelate decarboxylase